MGKVFFLSRKDYNNEEEIGENYSLKNLLNEKEADEFIVIQNQISKEITELINILTKDGLITKNPLQSEGMIYCISKNYNDECVGYGYGYIDNENNNVFYLDTIGVHSDYRRKGIGTNIKIALIKNAFENPQIDFIKTITQIENEATIRINGKLGFKAFETN